MLPPLLMKHTQVPASSDRAAPVDVRTLLVEDHARLRQLFDELVAAFRTGDRDECAVQWNAFDESLEAHMALEEQLILPELAKADPAEAAALAREHVALRTSLSELGIGVDLHCTNAGAVERFISVLETHAEREEALMYRWSLGNLQPDMQSTIRARLRASARKLVGSSNH